MGGEEVGSLYYDLDIDDKNIKSKLDSADKQVKSFGDRVGKAWDKSVNASKQFAIGLGLAGAAATYFGVQAVKAYKESETVAAQTNAVIKSTGGIAGVTAGQVDKLAKSIQYSSMYTDEQVASAENMLLTFTNIGSNVFPRATRAVADMAQAMGQDLTQTSIMVGKALQSPVQGVTALQRVGVRLTDSQKKLVEQMVATGDTAGAQALILKELETEFGGSALAALKAAGPMAILGKIWDDMTEIIGGLIDKYISPLALKLLELVDKAGGVEGIMKKMSDVIEDMKPYVWELTGALIGGLAPALFAAAGGAAAFVLTISPWLLLGAGIAFVVKKIVDHFGGWDNTVRAMQPWIEKAKKTWDEIYPILKLVGETVWNLLVAAWRVAVDIIKNEVWPWIEKHKEQLKAMAVVVGGAILVGLALFVIALAAIPLVILLIIDGFLKFMRFLGQLDEAIKHTLMSVGLRVLAFQDMINGNFKAAGEKWRMAGEEWGKALAVGIDSKKGEVTNSADASTRQALSAITSKMGEFGTAGKGIMDANAGGMASSGPKSPAEAAKAINNSLNILNSAKGPARNAGASTIDNHAAGMGSKAGAPIGTARNITASAVGQLGGMNGTARNSGAGMMDAYGNGMNARKGWLQGTLSNILSGLRRLLPFSDAKEGPLSDLTLSGTRMIETLATGVQRSKNSLYNAVSDTANHAMTALQKANASGLDISQAVVGPMASTIGSNRIPGLDSVITANVKQTGARGKGDTNVYIDKIEDRQDADYLLREFDRRQELEFMGGTPA